MNATATLSICRCSRCGGDIEYDPAAFQVSRESYRTAYGQTVLCPTCGLETELARPRQVPQSRTGQVLLLVIGLALILFGSKPIVLCTGLLLIAAALVISALHAIASKP